MKAKDTIYSGTAEGTFVSGFFFLISGALEHNVHGSQLLAVSLSALVPIVKEPPTCGLNTLKA